MDAPDSSGPAGSPASPGHAPRRRPGDSGPPDTDGLLAEQLLRLTRRLHRIQSRQLEPIGITPAQFRLLRTVASYDAAPRMADLAQRLDVVPRAVTTLVDALEASGRVRRAPDPTAGGSSGSRSPTRGTPPCGRCAARAGRPRRRSWHH